MHASGVICEFNPFHSGHAYLLSRMREQMGEEGCVVCLMSGRFVQRGEPAVADPYLRAEMALSGGADLVLELPFPWSSGSAEHFALAGVRALTRLGVDTLAFGSECGDPSLLAHAAGAIATPAFKEDYAALCRKGLGTAAAYAEALQAAVSLPLPKDFPSSNDLLGIAYLYALKKVTGECGEAPAPLIIPRRGAAYRETRLAEGEYPSASALRLLIREAACDPVALEAILEGTMPRCSLATLADAVRGGRAPMDARRLLSFYHALYRVRPADAWEGYAEWGGGLGSHVLRHAREAATPEAFFASLRTKQYTDARLRRALLFGALGVTAEDLKSPPRYTTLLAANRRGCDYLKARKKRADDMAHDFRVVTKPADAPAGRQRELGERADGLFTLCAPTPQDAGTLWRTTPRVIL